MSRVDDRLLDEIHRHSLEFEQRLNFGSQLGIAGAALNQKACARLRGHSQTFVKEILDLLPALRRVEHIFPVMRRLV
jgi:hypothetical protein